LFLNVKTFRKPYSKADEERVQRAALAATGEGVEAAGMDQHVAVVGEIDDPGAAIARQVASQSPDSGANELRDPTLWKPEEADEQAKLVDILQALAGYAPDKQWRLGIVVSAWEIIHNVAPDVMPRTWIKNAPLLRQYLESNPGSFDVHIFGVSAQGGDPEEEAARLQSIEMPSERVLVITDGYEGHDLTRVVIWLMEKHD
jgi:hypothetical protein